MAHEQLNPWADEHWNRIRNNPEYDAIEAAAILPDMAMDTDEFQHYAVKHHDGSAEDAMADLAPLSGFMEDIGELEAVFEACLKPDAEAS